MLLCFSAKKKHDIILKIVTNGITLIYFFWNAPEISDYIYMKQKLCCDSNFYFLSVCVFLTGTASASFGGGYFCGT